MFTVTNYQNVYFVYKWALNSNCFYSRSTLSQSAKNPQSHSTETLSSAHRNRSLLNPGCHDPSGRWFSCGPFPTSVAQAAEPLTPTALSAAGVLLPRFLSYCFCTACCCSFSLLTSSSAYTLNRGTGSFFSRSLCFSMASSKLKPTHSASSSGITNSLYLS